MAEPIIEFSVYFERPAFKPNGLHPGWAGLPKAVLGLTVCGVTVFFLDVTVV